jgi:hypothetical protein
MPAESLNRTRLEGESLSCALASAVMQRLKEQAVEPALRPLRTHYTAELIAIDLGYSIDYGEEWRGGRPQQANARIRLSGERFPPLFEIGVVLPVREDMTVTAPEDLARVTGDYATTALAPLWLRDFLASHPTPVELRLINGRSFSEKAMMAFERDLKALGKESLAATVKASQERVGLIIVQWQAGYWLVLPDRSMVLWRFSAPSGLLKWTPADVPAKDCASFRVVASQCVGAIVSPQGDLRTQ